MSFLTKAIIVTLSLLFLRVVFVRQPISQPKIQFQQKMNYTALKPNKTYKFHNPFVALKILNQLDVFVPVDEAYFKNGLTLKNRYTQPYLGLRSDNQYCERQRAAFVGNPERVFEKMNMFFDAEASQLIRKMAVPIIEKDMQAQVGDNRRRCLENIGLNVSIFWTSKSMNEYRHLGKQFSCLAQMSNHVLGREAIVGKDSVAENAIAYGQSFKSRPQCFSHDKFLPKTWLLDDKSDCENFFNILNSPGYEEAKNERQIVFIRKIASGSYQGEKAQPVDLAEEDDLKSIYGNGKQCGIVKKNYIVQRYIDNPLLLNGQKFDLRAYMLIASSDPMIAYYHDGFLKVNLAGDSSGCMDEEALKQAQQWSMEKLQEHLLEEGRITDVNWLNNHLRPQLKKAMIHLLRMTSHAFRKDKSTFELFSVDFLLDSNLNIWFMEANSGPAIEGGYSGSMEKFIVNMIQDHFEIEYGILKSRMKRVINYVNVLTTNGEAVLDADGEVEIGSLEMKKRKFREISKNSFEKEFEPKSTNGFERIIDANYEGAKVYQGYIDSECL